MHDVWYCLRGAPEPLMAAFLVCIAVAQGRTKKALFALTLKPESYFWVDLLHMLAQRFGSLSPVLCSRQRGGNEPSALNGALLVLPNHNENKNRYMVHVF